MNKEKQMSDWSLVTDKDKEIFKQGYNQAMKEVKEQWRCERCKYATDEIQCKFGSTRPFGLELAITNKYMSKDFYCKYFEPKDKE